MQTLLSLVFTVNPGGAPADSDGATTEVPVSAVHLHIRELENLARVATGPFGAGSIHSVTSANQEHEGTRLKVIMVSFR